MRCWLPNKVNRCLARYSLHATTTNRPTNRAPNKPAWPGPNWPKLPNLVVLGQKILIFYRRNQKFCYLHNGKPTWAPCSHWFLVRHWTNCAKNGNIWPKMTKTAYFGPILAILGPEILIFMGENHIDNLSALFFGQALDQMGQKCQYLAQNDQKCIFWTNFGRFWA